MMVNKKNVIGAVASLIATLDAAGSLDGEEIYLRVVSDELIELRYEREGGVVVKTYQVTDRDIEVDFC